MNIRVHSNAGNLHDSPLYLPPDNHRLLSGSGYIQTTNHLFFNILTSQVLLSHKKNKKNSCNRLQYVKKLSYFSAAIVMITKT